MKKTKNNNKITKTILDLQSEFGDPYEINNGRCSEFAHAVVKQVPEAKVYAEPEEECPSQIGHEWVEYRGKFYDAECPYGVDDWQNLPIFRRGRHNEKIGDWVDDLNIVDKRLKIIDDIRSIGYGLRDKLDQKHASLRGRCVGVSQKYKEELLKDNIDSKLVEGWCIYNKFENCTDRPYDEHTWLKVNIDDNSSVFADLTLDQFQPYRTNELEPVVIGQRPDFLYYTKPNKHDLRKIGWTQ